MKTTRPGRGRGRAGAASGRDLDPGRQQPSLTGGGADFSFECIGNVKAMRDALVLLRGFNLSEITYPLPGALVAADDMDGLNRLERFLRELERLLPSWSNNLSSRYFSHARTFPITIGV